MQVTADGIVLGAVYALVAVSMTLMYGVMRIINFAHGDLLTVGLYVSFFIVGANGGGLWAIVAAVAVVAVLGLVGVALFGALKPVLKKAELSHVMLTLGVSILIQNVAQLVFGANPRHFPATSWSVLRFGPIALETRHITTLVVATGVTAALFTVLARSQFGRSLRAVSENWELSSLVGIKSQRMVLAAMMLSTALIGLAAFLLLPLVSVSPLAGAHYTLIAFVVVVIGGLGDTLGAFIGALMVGLAEAYGSAYLSGNLAGILVFGLLFVSLVLRPRGILGRGRTL